MTHYDISFNNVKVSKLGQLPDIVSSLQESLDQVSCFRVNDTDVFLQVVQAELLAGRDMLLEFGKIHSPAPALAELTPTILELVGSKELVPLALLDVGSTGLHFEIRHPDDPPITMTLVMLDLSKSNFHESINDDPIETQVIEPHYVSQVPSTSIELLNNMFAKGTLFLVSDDGVVYLSVSEITDKLVIFSTARTQVAVDGKVSHDLYLRVNSLFTEGMLLEKLIVGNDGKTFVQYEDFKYYPALLGDINTDPSDQGDEFESIDPNTKNLNAFL